MSRREEEDEIYLSLLEAGAPDLPAEHFYRVSTWESLGYDIVKVQVRRRRWVKWWPGYCGSVLLGAATLRDDRDVDGPRPSALSHVVQTCRKAWVSVERTARAWEHEQALRKLEGDHP